MKKPELIKTMKEDLHLIFDENMSYPELLKLYYAELKKPQNTGDNTKSEPETKEKNQVVYTDEAVEIAEKLLRQVKNHEAEIKMLKIYCIGIFVLSVTVSGIIIFVTRKNKTA